MSNLKSFHTCVPRLALVFAAALGPLAAQSPFQQRVSLPGHVLPKLRDATLLPRTAAMLQEPFTFTILLNLSDRAGADAFHKEMSDPASAQYHKTIPREEFTARFGPTQQSYDSVLAYLENCGLTVVERSANRRTITVSGTRAQAEYALGVAINNYKLGSRTFHAVAADPALPPAVAQLIGGVAGLSNLAVWRPQGLPSPATPASIATAYDGALTPKGTTNTGGLPPGLDGAGRIIGLIEFDGFDINDVRNWLENYANLPVSLADQVSVYPVDGGTKPSGCTPPVAPGDKGCGTTEVLMDIEAVLGIAPGAKIVVLEAPPKTNYATVINAAFEQAEILSLSWGICESELPKAEVTSMDSLLADSGTTLFAAAGDTGSTCLDGAGTSFPNSISFPSAAAHTISVGGTILNVNKDNSYQNEDYWGAAPGFPLPPGAYVFGSGYGVSQYIPAPSYQAAFYPGASGRSIPDVVASAAPGIVVCQTTCVGPLGGTSLATPIWAATWALTQQAGADAGDSWDTTSPIWSPSDGYLYTIPHVFHSASTITSGVFADVGLGSPDITRLIATVVPPRVDSYSPANGGPAAGGTKITITGAGFIGVEKVTFGGVAATQLTIHSDTELTVMSPAAADSSVTIEVITPGGKAAAPGLYTYYPEIEGVSPNHGPLDGGITVTVTGLALGNASSFNFFNTSGTAGATGIKCSSSTKCTMTAPAHAAGTVDIIAFTPWGFGNSTANSKDKFTYQAAAITSFTPALGPTSGGMLITINGVGLQGGKTTVSFGGTLGTKVTCTGSTTCSVVNPAHVAGKVPLTVTVDGVTSAPAATEFEFAEFPTITSVSPTSGLAGATVTIQGTGFAFGSGQTTTIMFGGNAATGVTCTGTPRVVRMQCTAVVPPPPAGFVSAVPVSVTVNGNTSLKSLNFTYTDVPPPPPHKGTAGH